MTNIIILIRHARLPPPDVPPPLAVVLAAVERERRREQQLQPVADGAGEQLRVDVEGDGGVAVLRVRGEPRDAVVLLRVEGGEGEGVGEEVRVAHGVLVFWGGWVAVWGLGFVGEMWGRGGACLCVGGLRWWRVVGGAKEERGLGDYGTRT